MLRALVVDDEQLARRGVVMRLANIPGVEVIGECKNGEEAVAAIARETPDLVFLDIQMPGLSGFDVVRRLQADVMPEIVFVTAFDHYAIEAFKVNAIDYILKPVEETRLREAVQRATAAVAARDAEAEKARLLELVLSLEAPGSTSGPSTEDSVKPTEYLPIKEQGEIRFIPLDVIEWIDAAGDYMCVHAEGETHIMRSTMKDLMDRLPAPQFIRIHRSTLVNRDFISSAQSQHSGEYSLTLQGGAQLKVSRGYRDAIRSIIANSA